MTLYETFFDATLGAKQTRPGAFVFTDEAAAYKILRIFFRHRAVNHGDGEYVRGDAHCQGIEAFGRCSSVSSKAPATR